MRWEGGQLTLAATDLARFLACPHSSALDLAVAQGRRAKPRHRSDPALEALPMRGAQHERRYVDSLAAQCLRVVDGEGSDRTLAAMAEGADVGPPRPAPAKDAPSEVLADRLLRAAEVAARTARTPSSLARTLHAANG